jgi:hypothetical protein
MRALNEPIARRIGGLVRMFSSPYEDRHVAFTKLEHLLKDEGLSFNDLANSDRELQRRDRGTEIQRQRRGERSRSREKKRRAGSYDKARREMTAPPEFYDDYGEPRYDEIARYCPNNKERLRRDWDKTFVKDMPGKILSYSKPTPPQAKQLLRIYLVLGGVVDPQVLKTFS